MDTTALGPRVWSDPGRPQPRQVPVREPVRRPRPRRSVVPLVAALLAGVSALGVLGVAWALPAPQQAVASFEADANKAAVLGFYAAADDLLRTGTTDSLASAVAADVVAHDPATGALADRASLERRLQRLGAAYRDPRLTVLDVVADAEWVTARVELGAEGQHAAAGLAVSGATPVRQATERFRLVDGEIIEVWPATFAPDRAVDLPPTVVTPSPMDAVAAMARFAFAPGTALPSVVTLGPELIAVQAGALTVDLNRPAQLHRQGGGDPDWLRTAREGETVRLLPGDLLLVPLGVRHQVRNEGTAPAVALGLGSYPRTALYGNQDPAKWDVPLFVQFYNPGLLRFPTELAPGVVGEVLATASATAEAGRPIALTGGRVVLAPGEGIAPHRVVDSELLAVEAGMLGVDGADASLAGQIEVAPPRLPGTAAITPRNGGTGTGTGTGTGVIDLALGPTPGVVGAGDAVVRRSREVAGLTNLGQGEATVFVVTVGPAAERAVAQGDH